MKKLLIIAGIVLASVFGLGGGLTWVAHLIEAFTLVSNSHPPAYIKDVVAYKEGDGVVIYLTLADAQGALTSGDGQLTVFFKDDGLLPVWSSAQSITRTNFQAARVGRGPFERTTLLLSLGRIVESTFYAPRRSHRLTVEVTFTTSDVRRLTGSTSVWF